jgi:hypothetical protein
VPAGPDPTELIELANRILSDSGTADRTADMFVIQFNHATINVADVVIPEYLILSVGSGTSFDLVREYIRDRCQLQGRL